MKKPIQLSIILALTIIITRVTAIQIINPNPMIGNFEFHHIHYGAILLIFTLALLKNKTFFAPFIIISTGLIIDELEFAIRGFGNLAEYSATLPSTVILTLMIVPVILYKGRHHL